MNAAWIAGALVAAGATSTIAVPLGATPQALSAPKNTNPQFTFAPVAELTTVSIAVETCDHFEQPVAVQALPFESWAMESDRSWTISTSGGSGMIGTVAWPQLMPAAPPAPVRTTSPLAAAWPPPPDTLPPAPPAPAAPVVPAAPVPLPAMPVVPARETGAKPQPTRESSSRTRTNAARDRCMGTSARG